MNGKKYVTSSVQLQFKITLIYKQVIFTISHFNKKIAD